MITAITYQYQFSRKYDNKRLQYADPNSTTETLEAMLKRDAEITQRVYNLVSELNRKMEDDVKYMDNDEYEPQTVYDLFKNFLGAPRITQVTKKKRRYSLCGLTVHEEIL